MISVTKKSDVDCFFGCRAFWCWCVCRDHCYNHQQPTDLYLGKIWSETPHSKGLPPRRCEAMHNQHQGLSSWSLWASKNTILVSGVFWLCCEPRCRFNVPVSIEIEHCAESENTSKLTFVKALCSQKDLPYTFREIGGQFNKSSYGILELNSFSGLAILLRGSQGREYSARLFYLNQTVYTYEIHMVITWNIKLHRAVSVYKTYIPVHVQISYIGWGDLNFKS